jgi:hypothetical protein
VATLLRREIGLQTPDGCNDKITHKKAIISLKLLKAKKVRT